MFTLFRVLLMLIALCVFGGFVWLYLDGTTLNTKASLGELLVLFGMPLLGFALYVPLLEPKPVRARGTKAFAAGLCICAPFIHIVLRWALRGTAFELPSGLGTKNERSTVVSCIFTSVLFIGGLWWGAWTVDDKKDQGDASGHSR